MSADWIASGSVKAKQAWPLANSPDKPQSGHFAQHSPARIRDAGATREPVIDDRAFIAAQPQQSGNLVSVQANPRSFLDGGQQAAKLYRRRRLPFTGNG